MLTRGEYDRLQERETAASRLEQRNREMVAEISRLENERKQVLEKVATLRESLEEARAEAKARPSPPEPPRPPLRHRVETIGYSKEGRPLKLHIFEGERPSLFVFGAIHGSEPAGALLCDRLVEHLKANPPRRRTLVMPRSNPDGLRRGSRYNVSGVDLNRNFPAENFESSRRGGPRPLSEPETRALHTLLLVERPSEVLSIHQPLFCIDYDGPGSEELARKMAQWMDIPVRKLGTRPGSMGAWVGEYLGIPIITLELPEGVERNGAEAVWNAYGPAVLKTFLPDTIRADTPLLRQAK